jgi:putative transposase
MAPRANAHVERWIGSCRRECLDRMLVVNQRHLEAILREYCMHYNQERPHRSRELRPPAARGDPAIARTRGVRRRVRLGGLISEYYGEAVAA